jgi:TonB family protein
MKDKIFLVVLFLAAVCFRSNAQSTCSQMIVQDVGDGTKNYFRNPIELQDGTGKVTIAIHGVGIGEQTALILKVDSAKYCVAKGDSIKVVLAGDRTFATTNDFESNCDGEYAIFMGAQYGDTALLEALNTQLLKTLILQTRTNVVYADIQSDLAENFKKHFNCLIELGHPPDSSIVFVLVQQQPEFTGGYDAMRKFLSANMAKLNETGTVYVEFIVGHDGSIKDIKTIRGLSAKTDAEAERLVRIMPKWTPGRQSGRTAKVRFVLPINFKR